MDKKQICEAMYALPGGVVERRRKSPVTPIILTLIGVATIVLTNMYKAELNVNANSSLVVVGWGLVITGVAWLGTQIIGSNSVPYHNGAKSNLRYEELYFDRSLRGEVLEAVAEGNIVRLLGMKRHDIPAMTVALYRTLDCRFTAMQAFEYLDLEYKPLSDLKIVDRT